MNLREEIKDKIPAYFIPLCHICCLNIQLCGLPLWLSSKESACNAGDARGAGSVPGSGKSPREVCGNPLQYSSLENPMDREPASLQSMGRTVGHYWSDWACAHTSHRVLDIMIDVGNGQKSPTEVTLFCDFMDNSKINKQTVASKVTISAMEKSKTWKAYVYSVSGDRWGRMCVCLCERAMGGPGIVYIRKKFNSVLHKTKYFFIHQKIAKLLFCLTLKSCHTFRWWCSFSKREKQWNLDIFKADFSFDKFKLFPF